MFQSETSCTHFLSKFTGFELRRFEHTAVRRYRDRMKTNLNAIEGEYWKKWDRQLQEEKTQDKDVHGIHR